MLRHIGGQAPIPLATSVTLEQCRHEAKAYYESILAIQSCIEEYRRVVDAPKDEPRWYYITELHKILLDVYHDFAKAVDTARRMFGECAHMSEDEVLPKLWSDGICPLLKLLKDNDCCDSKEHMLTFIHFAYLQVASLYQLAPALRETWIRILADIARYRMDIEVDQEGRKAWSDISLSLEISFDSITRRTQHQAC
jgi:hypothetical protein